MANKNKVTPELIREGLVTSLRENRIVDPDCSLSLAEAACYHSLTGKTLKLNSTIKECVELTTITQLIEERNEVLKRWKSLFDFPYPL